MYMSAHNVGSCVRADWRTLLRGAIAVVIANVVIRFVAQKWDELRLSAAALRPSWSGLVLASVAVIVGYAILIASWRLLLRTWNSPLGVVDAARIWFVSSLGKYVPGKVWSIGAMAVLAKDAGASPIAATGSAIIMQLVNLAAGFAVVALAGAGDLLAAYPILRVGAWITVAATLVGLAYGPALLVWAVGQGTRLLRQPMPSMPVISRTTLVVPGGLGVRETALTGLLISLRLATPADAALLAAASRIWLTVLEILPGLAFLPGTPLRRRTSSSPPDGPAA